MANRAGEKFGWIGGWLGGFLWVVIMSVVFVAQQKPIQGVIGLVVAGVAVVAITTCAPWKHVNTPYWKLMLPVYATFAGSIIWALWSVGGASGLGLNWWSAFLVLPLLIPFGTVGKRRWSDFDA
jgi:hypothetical protein